MSYGHAAAVLEGRAFTEGAQARREKKPLASNPYDPRFQRSWHEAWNQGWGAK